VLHRELFINQATKSFLKKSKVNLICISRNGTFQFCFYTFSNLKVVPCANVLKYYDVPLVIIEGDNYKEHRTTKIYR
jgi:hypothetical protein